MNANGSTERFTAGDMLFRQKDKHDSLRDAFLKQSVVDFESATMTGVSSPARRALIDKLVAASAVLFDIPLIGVLARGWRKYSVLMAAAERSMASPEDSELVQLVTHRITSIHKPTIDIMANDVVVSTVHFEIDLELEIKSLVVEVQYGRIIAVHAGNCDFVGKALVESKEFVTEQVEVELPMVIYLDQGIALLPVKHEPLISLSERPIE